MTSLTEDLQLGFRNVRAHRMRSGLTVLGVIFGVAAVVAMLAIAGGAQKVALDQIRLLGTDAIRVTHIELADEALERAERQGSRGLRSADARLLGRWLPGLSALAPIRFVEAPLLRRGRESTARVVATNDEYFRIGERSAADGRALSQLDVRYAKRVAVLGAALKGELFGYQDPIGRDVRIGETQFTVVGWMPAQTVRSEQPGMIQMRDVNRDVYIPITTAHRRFPDPEREDPVHELATRLVDESQVHSAAEIMERLLLRSHRGVRDFEVRLSEELLARAQGTQRVFNVVLGSIAAISLLVGGIGIMNVMLTTVTERTREIGIRRATGATRRGIRRQFLAESVVISSFGGVTGIVVGLVLGRIIHLYAGWETAVSPVGIALAFGISVLIGVCFGVVPARRAAQLDPIQALRFE